MMWVHQNMPEYLQYIKYCLYIYICVCFAVVGLDYKLYKIHNTYIKIIHNVNYFKQNYEIFQAVHHMSSF